MIPGKLWKHYLQKLKYFEINVVDIMRNFRKFFWNNFIVIGKKPRKNLEYLWKNIENTSHKLKNNFFWWKLCEIFKVIYIVGTETSNNFREELQSTPKKIWKYSRRFWKFVPGREERGLQSIIRHCVHIEKFFKSINSLIFFL